MSALPSSAEHLQPICPEADVEYDQTVATLLAPQIERASPQAVRMPPPRSPMPQVISVQAHQAAHDGLRACASDLSRPDGGAMMRQVEPASTACCSGGAAPPDVVCDEDDGARWRDAFEERAAIIEYLGGADRAEADALAYADTLARWWEEYPNISEATFAALIGAAHRRGDGQVSDREVEPGHRAAVEHTRAAPLDCRRRSRAPPIPMRSRDVGFPT